MNDYGRKRIILKALGKDKRGQLSISDFGGEK